MVASSSTTRRGDALAGDEQTLMAGGGAALGVRVDGLVVKGGSSVPVPVPVPGSGLVRGSRPGPGPEQAFEDSTLLAMPAGNAEQPVVVVQRGLGPGPSGEPQGAPPEHLEDLGDLVTVPREHYSVGKEFARGGMGKVLAARDRRLGRSVAIKELITPRSELHPRFVREARITGRLQHPSIVPIYEQGRWPSGEPFYVMKHIKGRPLSRLVAEARNPADRLALLPRVTAVAEAIAFAHSQRIIHRDLKPGNVLVGDYGETVVIDWGLAKELDEPGDEAGEAGEAGEAPAGSAGGGEDLQQGEGKDGRGDKASAEALAETRRERPRRPERRLGDLRDSGRATLDEGEGEATGGSGGSPPGSSPPGSSPPGSSPPGSSPPGSSPPGSSGRSSQGGSSQAASSGAASTTGGSKGSSRAATRRPSSGAEGLTVAGAVMGTPAYMPPEQARGEPVDERADVYALGAILYNCLSGHHPYEGKTSEQVLADLATGPPRPLGELQPDLAPDLLSIVDKAMATEPAARYPSAEELAADLRRFQRGQLVGAHHYGGAALVRRWVRRNRVAVGITAGFLVALGVLGVVGLMRIVQERDRAEAQRGRAERASAEARGRAVEAREHARAATARLATFYADEGRRELLAGHSQRAIAYLAEAWRLGQRGLPVRILLGLSARQLAPARAVVEAHHAPVEAVSFSSDGRFLFTAGLDRLLRRWTVPELRLEKTFAFGGFPLRFSPDGTLLLVGQRDQPSLALLEAATGRQRCALRGEGHGAILRVAWSEDGRRLAGHAPGGAAVVWDLPSCSVAARIPVEGGRMAAGRRQAAGGRLAEVLHYPTSASLPPASPGPEVTRILPGSLGLDGRLLAVATERRTVEMWDVGAGRLLATTARPHDKAISALGLVQGGETLVTGSEDGALVLWDVSTGKERAALPAHRGQVTSLVPSPDGRRFATAGLDGTVRLFDPTGGEAPTTLRGLGRAVKHLR
ncbi:MAG: serine/threonine-protein kinase, partial [Polyangia bacterium]|nr:serine/threonine-protein kinase [Polyangia bacterium]